MSMYIGNLLYQVTLENLSSVLPEYATVKHVQIPTNHEISRFCWFSFVEMESEAEEEATIQELDGAKWMGRTLNVNKAKPRENHKRSGSYAPSC